MEEYGKIFGSRAVSAVDGPDPALHGVIRKNANSKAQVRDEDN
jgi:hypothetical protein